MNTTLLSKSGKNQKANSKLFLGFFTGLVFLTFSFQQAKAQNCSVNSGVDQTICANEALVLYGLKSGSFPAVPITTWTQVGGPAAIITTPNSLTSSVTNFVGNTTLIFRLSTTCQDGSFVTQDVNYFIKPTATAYAGPDASYCPGATANLNATAAGAGNTGTWSGSGGGVTVNSINDPNSSLTIVGTSSGPVTLRWTVTNPSGCASYDEVVITNLGGVLPIDAGTNQTLGHCYSTTQSTSLSGSNGGTFGTWTIVSGPNVPTIANPNSNNTGVSNLIQGTYTFRWTVDGPCVSGTDLVTIVVPAATATVTSPSVSGGNQIFCDGRTSTVLSATAPLYINETVAWVQTGGPTLPGGSIVSPTSPVTVVNNLDGISTYTFSYTITNSTLLPTACSNSTNVTVSYYLNSPTITITGPDPIVLACGVSSTPIPYTFTGSGVNQYSILSGPVTTGIPSFPTSWINATDYSQIVSGLTASGTYVVQLRRFTNTNVSCSNAYDQVSITTSFAGAAANAGTDQILDCNVTATDLQGNDPTVIPGQIGEGTWSQVSGPSTITIAHPNHHNPTLSVTGLLIDQIYTFRWLVTGGSSCNVSQDDVTVKTSSNNPDPTNAGPDQSVCNGSPVYLHATAPTHAFETGGWKVTPSAGVIISDTNSPNPTVTGLLPFTTYTFTWQVRNGCGATSDFMLVDVNDTNGPKASAAGPDQCLPGATGALMAGNDPSPGTGLWSFATGSPTATITSPTLYNTTLSGMSPNTYTLVWTISRNSSGCASTRDTVLLTVKSPLEVAAYAGADKYVCGNSTSLTAIGTVPSGATTLWTQIMGNGGAVIVSPTSATTSITGLTAGGELSAMYKFRYAITNGACISADTVTVFVSDAASNAVIALTSQTICEPSILTLTADAITSGIGLWTVVSGPNTPTIVSPSASTTTVNNLITGNYKFRWTVTGGTYCTPTSDSITVAVTQAANAGANQSYCEAITSVNLVGTTSSAGTWTQVGTTPNTATITSTSANTATASGLIPGVYTFRYSIGVSGCTSQDDMTVTLYTPPSISAAGPDQELCETGHSNFQMAATTPASGTGAWTVLLRPSGETGSFNNASLPDAVYTPAGNKYGVFVFEWTVANISCTNADQVRVTYYQEPSTANAGADQNVVCTTSTTMAATDPAVGLGTWTFISKSGNGPTPTITNPILYNSTITNLGIESSPADSTTYLFKWTVTNGNCAEKTDYVNIRVYEPPTAANAGADQLICEQTSVTLTATNPTVGTGSWSFISAVPASTPSIVSPTNNSTLVNDLVPGTTYVFRYTTTTTLGPCTSYDDVTVTNSLLPTTATATGTATSYCTLVPITLIGNTPTVGTGLWSQIDGDALSILSPSSTSTSAVGAESGQSYTFRWTISNGGCPPSSRDVTVTMNNVPPQAQAGPDTTLCAATTTTLAAATSILSATYTVTQPSCFGSLGSISVTGAGGIAPFAYRLDGGTLQSSGVFTGLSAGSHAVVVSDQNSCNYTVRFVITVPTALTIVSPSQINVKCKGATTGSALLSASGGTAPYTFTTQAYPLSGLPTLVGNLATNMKAGTYTFRVTDANACANDVNVTITEPSATLSVSATAHIPTCVGGLDGSITTTVTGGTSPYSYQWSNGSTDAAPNGLTAGSYSVQITDANGCIVTDGPIPVSDNPSPVTLTPSANTAVTACNAGDGSITLTGSEAGNISLDGGANETSAHTYNGLAAGHHIATFTSTSGSCTATSSFDIANTGSTLSATASVTNPNCYGGTGEVTINPSGGTGPYTYLLDGATSGGPSFSTLAGGVHFVLVTDDAGCTYIVYFTITVPTQLTISLTSQTNINCNGSTNGTALVKATGGTPGYTFSIDA
ncbi:MAG: PKD domain-containing protein, partial [Bacteroidales bacterium]